MSGEAVTGGSSGPDRVNRVGLSLFGLLLAGAAVYGLARGWGAFGASAASDPLLLDSWREFTIRNERWFWPAAAVASLVVGLLGLRWLRAQLAAATAEPIDLTHRGDAGTTTVHPAGAARALAEDVETHRNVNRATARLVGTPEAPEVDLRVDVTADCDLPALRTWIDEEALVRFERALEFTELDANVEFRLTAPVGRRRLR